MSDPELSQFHERIKTGESYFQKGIQLTFLPDKAYVSQNFVYIYLEIDGVLLLQKQTAIVNRNRTEDPNKRVTQQITESFYEQLGLNQEGKLNTNTSYQPILPEETGASDLEKQLPKTGRCLATMGTGHVDTVHNLLFGTNFREYIHFDYDMKRLIGLVGNLKKNSNYVLCDQEIIPVANDSLDAVYSFEYLEGLEKTTQNDLFESLNKAMNANGVAIMLNTGHKQSQLENRYKAVKTKAAFTPWKKNQVAQMLFRTVSVESPMRSDAFSGKKSWGSQLY